MELRIKYKKGEKTFQTSNKNILQVLAENRIFINSYCGGRGLCKKCVIKYINKPPEPQEIELTIFSDEELKSGTRLACLHELRDGDFIEIFEPEPVFKNIESEICVDANKDFIALDIGTTTISIALIKERKLLNVVNILNPQISFGSDVLNRISYSSENKTKILSDILNERIYGIIENLKNNYGIDKIEKMVVAANPTMLSFFLNMDPSPIGIFPYKPPFTGSFHKYWNGINVYIPPIISAFVGSDITAGLLNVDLTENFLFIDIGTNCEFILKIGDSVYSASVPGGPALEGSGIDYGMMAQKGAIEKIEFNSVFKCLTIGDIKAKGIAGSGLISAIALLKKYDIIEKTGRIKEPWEIEDIPLPLLNRIKKEGFLLDNGIYLTQKSIREFQLTKAALSAGLEILLKKTGCKMDNIDKIYIAGGFTNSLSKEEMLDSNLLNVDKDFIFLGNSAIKGSLKLFCKKNIQTIEEFSKKIDYIEIANEDDFQKFYIESMDFIR